MAVSISAERTNEALEPRLGEYAAGVLEGLEGSGFTTVHAGKPHPFEHRYRAEAVTARGRRASGVRERLRAVALRRDRQVTFAVLIARRASVHPGIYRTRLRRMIGSLRSRPVEAGG